MVDCGLGVRKAAAGRTPGGIGMEDYALAVSVSSVRDDTMEGSASSGQREPRRAKARARHALGLSHGVVWLPVAQPGKAWGPNRYDAVLRYNLKCRCRVMQVWGRGGKWTAAPGPWQSRTPPFVLAQSRGAPGRTQSHLSIAPSLPLVLQRDSLGSTSPASRGAPAQPAPRVPSASTPTGRERQDPAAFTLLLRPP